MTSAAELLPCPICGKKVYIGLYNDGCDYWWMIHGGMHYDECHCRLFMESCKFELEDETRADYDEHAMGIRGGLARRWNQRAAVTPEQFSVAVHDGNFWRQVKDHIRCRCCGLNIESVISLDGCNEHAIKHCPNCGKEVTR